MCGIPVPSDIRSDYVICSTCRKHQFSFDKARAWGPYEKELRRVIRCYKFVGFRRLAYPLARLLIHTFNRHFLKERIEILLPVPLYSSRRRQRGFDQTSLLTQILALETGLPISRAVSRVKNTIPQFGLNLENRKKNLHQAFQVNNPSALEKKRVLIIDDVMTTGATVQELSILLRSKAKVPYIGVLAIARVSRLFPS